MSLKLYEDEKKEEIEIKPSEEGSFTAIAKKEGGLKSNGEINREWAKKKLDSPKTSPKVKKKANFFLNFTKNK